VQILYFFSYFKSRVLQLQTPSNNAFSHNATKQIAMMNIKLMIIEEGKEDA